MVQKNVLRACVPPSITNLASLVPFVFSLDASNIADILQHIKTMKNSETAVLLAS